MTTRASLEAELADELHRNRRLRVLVALVLAFAFSVLYWAVNKSWSGFVPSVACNLVATLITFAAVYFFVEWWAQGVSSKTMGLLLRAPFTRHDRVDWGEIIRTSERLDIVVFYYSKWVRQHHDDFVHFFRNGGKLRLFVSDPENLEVMATVQRHFFPTLTTEELTKKIDDTYDVLIDAAKEADAATASVIAYEFPDVLHYTFVLADSQHLYLSVYEQFRNPVIKSQVFTLELRDDAELGAYWRTVRDTFIAQSRETALFPDVAEDKSAH